MNFENNHIDGTIKECMQDGFYMWIRPYVTLGSRRKVVHNYNNTKLNESVVFTVKITDTNQMSVI